jgi:hypothetical protein
MTFTDRYFLAWAFILLLGASLFDSFANEAVRVAVEHPARPEP